MTSCAFVGLGVMGRQMAGNLLRAGHTVTVHNRSAGPVTELVGSGARPADTPAQAARDAEVVFTCLTDGPVVAEAVLGDSGVLEGASPATIVVDHSTIDPRTAGRIAAACAERDVTALDAPVSGGVDGAREATLSIMVGGERAAFDRVRPLLEALGDTIEHVGGPGAGQRTKAANQLLVAGIYTLVSEAMLLLEAGGDDTAAALRVLAGGLAGNRIIERRSEAMRRRSFTAGARVDLHRKDLGIVLDLARDSGVAVPVTAVVAQLYESLAARGLGDLDHSAVLLVLEQLAGADGTHAPHGTVDDRVTGA